MSAAWHGGLPLADQYVNSEALRSAISSAIGYWFSNDFTNTACLDRGGLAACPCGTPGLWNTNWFSNVGRNAQTMPFPNYLYIRCIGDIDPRICWTSLPAFERHSLNDRDCRMQPHNSSSFWHLQYVH